MINVDLNSGAITPLSPDIRYFTMKLIRDPGRGPDQLGDIAQKVWHFPLRAPS
jgi:hypothetical protein